MNLKTVPAAENMVKNILANKAEEEKRLAEAVETEKAAIAKAAEEMEAATAAGDVKAYQKAKAVLRDSEDAKEMHEKRQKALKQKPLISEAEYEKTVAEIFTEIATADNHTRERLAMLSDQMEIAVQELQEAFTRANVVLHQLQHDVYMDADRSRNAKGEMLRLAHEDKKVDKWETVNWGKAGVSHYQYFLFTGRKVQ